MLKKSIWQIFAVLMFAFLYVPVIVLIVFSFNDNSIMKLPLSGFTFDWYKAAFANEQILSALKNSLIVAGCTTVLSLAVGIPAALAINRVDFWGKSIFSRTILLPIALPGVITGISLLSFFSSMGFRLNLSTIILGHTVALTSITVTQILSRLQNFNERLEEASADLGARGIETFFFVTLPNIRTAIIGSALLVFTLSFDEIPITFFLTGRDNTLPMYMYSVMRRGITPELNAIGSVIIVVSLVLLVASVLLLNRSKKSAR